MGEYPAQQGCARTRPAPRLFSKLRKEITVRQDVYPDPDKNPRLRLAVKEAKSQSRLPKYVNSSGRSRKPGRRCRHLRKIRYEVYVAGRRGGDRRGPMTDNSQPHRQHGASTFGKHGGNLVETGSSASCSNARARIHVSGEAPAMPTPLMMAGIEAGAEDCKAREEGPLIICADNRSERGPTALRGPWARPRSTRLHLAAADHRAVDLEGGRR